MITVKYVTLKELNEQYGGKLTRGLALRRNDDELPPPSPARPKTPAKEKPKPSPSSCVSSPTDADKLASGLKQFYRALARHHRAGGAKLKPAAVAIWSWLWYCAHKRRGRAKTSARKLKERFALGSKDTAGTHLTALETAGFLTVVRRGKFTRSATIYRVRPTPKPPNAPTGPEQQTVPKTGTGVAKTGTVSVPISGT